jgi:phosphoribosylanthranilate isomerase
MRTRLKVCCIQNWAEAAMAIAAGADALGLVAEMPSGPGPIDDQLIAEIAARVPPGVTAILLTARTNADGIAEHARSTGVHAVQIVSPVPAAELARLARLAPSLRRLQVVHVEGAEALGLIDELGPHVHSFLLDSGRPSLAIPELGGTGRAHDWDISRVFVAASPKPVFLAGGLNPANAAQAIDKVRPFGLDLCSGIRIEGRLDHAKLLAFVQAMA